MQVFTCSIGISSPGCTADQLLEPRVNRESRIIGGRLRDCAIYAPKQLTKPEGAAKTYLARRVSMHLEVSQSGRLPPARYLTPSRGMAIHVQDVTEPGVLPHGDSPI